MKSKRAAGLAIAAASLASMAVLSGCAGATTSAGESPSATSSTSSTTVQRDAAWGYKSTNVCIYNHNSEPIHVKWEKYDTVSTAPDLEVAPSGKTCAEGTNVGQTLQYKALDSKKLWSYDVSGTITERGKPVSSPPRT